MSEARPKVSKAAGELAAAAFRQYSPLLHQYLVRRLHGGTDVPNLAMEIYERFMRVKDIETYRSPRAILFRIARFVVAETLRLESSRLVTYDSEAMTDAGESLELAVEDNLGERRDTAQRLGEVREAMKQLSPMHQAVLWLAVHDGLSHKEVSQRTGLTVKTVGLYVCEARSRLRTTLELARR